MREIGNKERVPKFPECGWRRLGPVLSHFLSKCSKEKPLERWGWERVIQKLQTGRWGLGSAPLIPDDRTTKAGQARKEDPLFYPTGTQGRRGATAPVLLGSSLNPQYIKA